MSRASKITLASTATMAAGIVYLVHYWQQAEKAVCRYCSLYDPSQCTIREYSYCVQAMHAGVIRDLEQQKVKRERQADFDMQRALEQEYRKVQTVHDGSSPLECKEGKT